MSRLDLPRFDNQSIVLNETPANIYFDDFSIKHTKAIKVVQENHYYPFGMSMKGLELKGNPDHRFKFNGKERTPSFTRPDPLAENNYHLTPYHALSNNPINRIDPDGKDDFEINHKGEIVNRIKNKEADNFYIVNKEGKRVEGQSISFDYGTVEHVKNPELKFRNKEGEVKKKPVTIFRVNGDENATQLFEFLADPASTNVEFTHAKIGTENSNSNIIGTSHEKSATPVGHYLRRTGYTLKEVNHNHPRGTGPSGRLDGKRGDIPNAKLYHRKNPNTMLKVYIHPNKYIYYSEYGAMLAPLEITPDDDK